MPTPSYSVLRKQRDNALRAFNDLAEDPDFGVTTYRALLYALMHLGEQEAEFVVLISFEKDIHPRMVGTVKRLLHMLGVPRPKVLLRGCGENPGEFVFLLDSDPETFLIALTNSANKAGFRFSNAWCPFTGDIYNDIRTCQAVIQAKREGYPA